MCSVSNSRLCSGSEQVKPSAWLFQYKCSRYFHTLVNQNQYKPSQIEGSGLARALKFPVHIYVLNKAINA